MSSESRESTRLWLLVLLFILAAPFVQSGVKAEVVSAKDGVPIHYWVQGKGEPTLVFVHCWSCDRNLWDNQVPVFAKNHRVVTLDLPGHGESSEGRKTWSVESYADDVNVVLTKLNLKRVILIGSSMGGPIVLEATRRMPERVLAIVPVDTLHNVETTVDPKQLEEALKQLRANYKAAATGFLNQLYFSPSTPAAVKNRITSNVTARPPELAIPILEAILAYRAAPALGEVKVPIHAINADMTRTSLEVNRKYAPQFEAVIMKGSGHYPMLEDPTRFNELLADIIRKVQARSKMSMPEYLPQLNEAVAQLIARSDIHSLVDSLKTQLPQTSEPFVWSTIDLQSITTRLPDSIRSGWIFVLKKDVSSGCHYHPNSIQHMVMVEGEGTSKVGPDSRPMKLFGDPHSSLDDVWYVIPEGMPHEFFPKGQDLVVLSFHTCTSDELEEISCDSGATRNYDPRS